MIVTIDVNNTFIRIFFMEIESYLVRLENRKKKTVLLEITSTMYHEKYEGHNFAQSLI